MMDTGSLSTAGMDVAGRIIAVILGLIGTAIRSFAGAMLLLELCWGGFIAFLCFYFAADGSFLRGLLAAVLAIVLVTITAIVLSAGYAAVVTIRRAVKEAGIGRMIFERLFDLMGIGERKDVNTGASAGEEPAMISVRELESRLKSAASQMTGRDAKPSIWTAPLVRAAGWIMRVAVMTTVRVVIRSCSADGETVRPSDIRDRLAATIDDRIATFLQEVQVRQSISIVIAITALAGLLALGIRQLPM